MTVTIELPQTTTPRTHIAAKVACDYVSYELRNLPPDTWTTLMRDGSIGGQVEAEFVGIVKYTVTADKQVTQ